MASSNVVVEAAAEIEHLLAQVTSGLEPYVPSATMPWNARRAAHLLRRTGFGATRQQTLALLNRNPLDVVDDIIDEALNLPVPNTTPHPEGYIHYHRDWLKDMYTWGFREKMAFFWSGHFVTQQDVYSESRFAQEYLRLLRKHALGNFKTFTREIGTSAAMLIYLDGTKNRRGQPNENYARELLELFTMGLGHYSQQDIVEAARALTGWYVDLVLKQVEFIPRNFDNGTKRIFGRTGNFDHDDVINLIFEERTREVAQFICHKIYKFFVYDFPKATIVDALADVFIAEGFQIEPVIRRLFRSQHFFDAAFLGVKIKTPLEVYFTTIREASMEVEGPNNYDAFQAGNFILGQFQQRLLNPPNVSGWPSHRQWISSATLAKRWRYAGALCNNNHSNTTALLDQVSNPDDPFVVARELAEHLLPVPLSDRAYQKLGEFLLGNTPAYEWDPLSPSTQARLAGFMVHLVQLPEFQLT